MGEKKQKEFLIDIIDLNNVNSFDFFFIRKCNTKEENLSRDRRIHMVDVAQLEEH